MYEKDFLASSFSYANGASYVLYLEKDLDGIKMNEGQTDDSISVHTSDLSIATPSNSSVSYIDSLTEVPIDSFEEIVIDRLNVISISAIISTCFLFLLLIRRKRG